MGKDREGVKNMGKDRERVKNRDCEREMKGGIAEQKREERGLRWREYGEREERKKETEGGKRDSGGRERR